MISPLKIQTLMPMMPVGGLGLAVTEVDVGAQRVQRHATFATAPLPAVQFRAAETARNVDADAECAEPQRRLHRDAHRRRNATRRRTAVRCLRRPAQHRFRLADLEDVRCALPTTSARDLAAQLLDVGALLADQHAGTRRYARSHGTSCAGVDHDLADAGGTLMLLDMVADRHVFVQKPAVFAGLGEPTAVPGAIDAEAETDGLTL